MTDPSQRAADLEQQYVNEYEGTEEELTGLDPERSREDQTTERVEAVVGVRGRHERAGGAHASTSNSRNWAREPSSRRARTRVPVSPWVSTSTSPSRCTAASASARS